MCQEQTKGKGKQLNVQTDLSVLRKNLKPGVRGEDTVGRLKEYD